MAFAIYSMNKIKQKTKKRIIYTVLTTFLFAIGAFFDVFSIATKGLDAYKNYQVTTSMNKIDNFQQDENLSKEITKLSAQKQKLESKKSQCKNAISVLEVKLQELKTDEDSFLLGNTKISKESGQLLYKQLTQRHNNLVQKVDYVNTILLNKQEQFRKANAIRDQLEEDGLEIQMQKLEIQKLQQEISNLQNKVQQKQDYINEKAQDIQSENAAQEEANIDNIIFDINNK
ncbi:hypothetical protein [Candidatus Uabimicrobium sp. HlEnr_7]|uniref:hypothetical protein n=1 Tax=Candidatus Uabimicrobium helgolandensis TaxID=3095367 RepID=UPI0035587ED4